MQRKCDRYWPLEDTETYGNIEATLLKEQVMANYTVRTIKLKHLKVFCNVLFIGYGPKEMSNTVYVWKACSLYKMSKPC